MSVFSFPQKLVVGCDIGALGWEVGCLVFIPTLPDM